MMDIKKPVSVKKNIGSGYALCEADGDCFADVYFGPTADYLARLINAEEKVVEALEMLMAVQYEPPLLNRSNQWHEAMDKCTAALAVMKGAT